MSWKVTFWWNENNDDEKKKEINKPTRTDMVKSRKEISLIMPIQNKIERKYALKLDSLSCSFTSISFLITMNMRDYQTLHVDTN
jgi:hypothetical protein